MKKRNRPRETHQARIGRLARAKAELVSFPERKQVHDIGNKFLKGTSKYLNVSKDPQQTCKKCIYYKPDQYACKRVIGNIKRGGSCKFFTIKVFKPIQKAKRKDILIPGQPTIY